MPFSSEILRILFRNSLLSHWLEDYFDVLKSLMPPLVMSFSSEMPKIVSQNSSISHWHDDCFDIRKSLIPPRRNHAPGRAIIHHTMNDVVE